MHPAGSLVAFSSLSGFGFGLFFFLGLGLVDPRGLAAFGFYALAYGLALAGLLSSTLHLANPRNAIKAFSQWRSSWLSREGLAAVATLLIFAPLAFGQVFLDVKVSFLGWLGAPLALGTVFTTAMIYAQLKTVPRWHTTLTPALFLAFSLAGGALLVGQIHLGFALTLLVLALQLLHWWRGDRAWQGRNSTLGTATALDSLGEVRHFESAHTAKSYLTDEMVHQIGRKHAQRLRFIVLALLVLGLGLAWLPLAPLAAGSAAFALLLASLVSRWLFFAEAEHVLGLYYGRT